MKKLRPWLVVALVFLAGAVFGVVTTRVAVRHFVRTVISQPEKLRDRIERNLTRRLKLDDEQRLQVHAALIRGHERLQTLRQEFQPRFTEILEDTKGEISAVLTPEQCERFEKFRQENRHLWQPR